MAFGMDANTGHLLPGQPVSSSQESGGSDLLETPALATLPSQNRSAPGPSRLRIATQQSSGDEQEEVSAPLPLLITVWKLHTKDLPIQLVARHLPCQQKLHSTTDPAVCATIYSRLAACLPGHILAGRACGWLL